MKFSMCSFPMRSNKFTEPNILPTMAVNWHGRLIKENGSAAMIQVVPNIKIPEGYKITSVPENLKLVLPNKG